MALKLSSNAADLARIIAGRESVIGAGESHLCGLHSSLVTEFVTTVPTLGGHVFVDLRTNAFRS